MVGLSQGPLLGHIDSTEKCFFPQYYPHYLLLPASRRRLYRFHVDPKTMPIPDFLLFLLLLLLFCSVILSQDFVSVEGTGGAVWRPSVQFGKFVCGPKGRRSLPLAGKSVLEISSGLGLGAIVAWHLGASPVVS